MDKNCQICGERLYTYNSNVIVHDEKTIESCLTCKQRFDDLLDVNNQNHEGSKQYFSSLEHGRLYSKVVVNGNEVHFIQNRDNFDARDIQAIYDNTVKIVNDDNVLIQKSNQTIHVLNNINQNLSDIKKVLNFFYYFAIASLMMGGLFLFMSLFIR